MISIIYMVCLLITISNLIYLSQKTYKQTDRYLWTIILLIPLVILGYWIKSTAHSPEAVMVAFCFIYIDSTVLPVVLLFSLVKSIEWKISPWVKFSSYAITILHVFGIWLNRGTKLYYSSVELEETALGTVTIMSSGPLKVTHYIFLGILTIAYIAVLIVAFSKQGTKSKKNLIVYAMSVIVMFFVYVLEMFLGAKFTILPVMYTIGSLVITINYEHIQSHNIFNLIGERQAKLGFRGFCAFDMKRCLLGYNNQFAEMVPDIRKVVVDERIPRECKELASSINNAIDEFNQMGKFSEKIVIKDRIFQFIVSDFSVSRNGKQNGYLVEVSDITDEQNRIDTIEKYNERLSLEVSQKTENILEIQNAVVLGLANMVENRDDNTGGHVKRTSEVIKLLVREIQRQGVYKIDSKKAKDIIRSAPMHDLGKISIDSDILCKPGKLTDEEYAIMKTHAPKSGEIVKIILEGVEEQHFVDVAYNVARHHHERWDGKGYPEGLMGESIPLEARIMAVADVYDALVSKRCYKAAMSFEKAFQIMNENMGSQFDPGMRPVFVACREKLEAYYSQDS